MTRPAMRPECLVVLLIVPPCSSIFGKFFIFLIISRYSRFSVVVFKTWFKGYKVNGMIYGNYSVCRHAHGCGSHGASDPGRGLLFTACDLMSTCFKNFRGAGRLFVTPISGVTISSVLKGLAQSSIRREAEQASPSSVAFESIVTT